MNDGETKKKGEEHEKEEEEEEKQRKLIWCRAINIIPAPAHIDWHKCIVRTSCTIENSADAYENQKMTREDFTKKPHKIWPAIIDYAKLKTLNGTTKSNKHFDHSILRCNEPLLQENNSVTVRRKAA